MEIIISNDKEILTNVIDIRKKVYQNIASLISSIDESIFDEEIEVDFGKKTLTKKLWQLLLQWFNHQTHHCGQISLQFELIGQDNDYSSIIGKIEE